MLDDNVLGTDRREVEPLQRHRRTALVASESFELLPLLGFNPHTCVQREPRVLRDAFPGLVFSRRHGLPFASLRARSRTARRHLSARLAKRGRARDPLATFLRRRG
jgi:hypothetical protein